MIVINLCASPGAGKSTGAAYIFSKLKMAGINCELVTEVAKDKVWEKNNKALENQAYIFGQQYFRLSRLEGEVDVVVTDSSLILGILYNKDPKLGKVFNEMIINVAKSFESLNYFIRRVKPYNPKGRLQTEEESDQISHAVKKLLQEHFPNYEEIDGNEDGYNKIVRRVLEYINQKDKNI